MQAPDPAELREAVAGGVCQTIKGKNQADWLKPKCVGHLLRNLSEIAARKTRGAVRFARAVTALLREALALKAENAALAEAVFAARGDPGAALGCVD